ncbi:unnamed protein product, partial [Cyprideis torosa]
MWGIGLSDRKMNSGFSVTEVEDGAYYFMCIGDKHVWLCPRARPSNEGNGTGILEVETYDGQIQWYRNSEEILTTQHFMSSGTRFTIRDAWHTHGGDFSCLWVEENKRFHFTLDVLLKRRVECGGDVGGGKRRRKKPLERRGEKERTSRVWVRSGTLSVEEGPRVRPVISPGGNMELTYPGQPGQLRCIPMQGNPAPSISWFKDGRPLSPEDGWTIPPDSYRIVKDILTFKDRGNYSCHLTNELGTATKHIFLQLD